MDGPESDTGDCQSTIADETEFLRARDLISAAIAAYSARIGRGDSAEHAAGLRAERERHLALRAQLSVADRAMVSRVLVEYPGLIRRLREH